MQLLSQETAVVTGASSGNGRAIARTFAENGADVVVADIQEGPRMDDRPTHELINDRTNARATYVDCDVSDRTDIQNAVDAADEFGGIDILVNNAGILRIVDFFEEEEEYRQQMSVNVDGVFEASKIAGKKMVANGGGSIVNISSVDAYFGDGRFVGYCTSKGAVQTMTYALADALAPDVRVNAIHPGPIETAQTTYDADLIGTEAEQERVETIPVGRIGVPQDIANASLFLVSELADFVNAASLLVDGGQSNTHSH